MIRREEGSTTIEATIAFSIFLLGIFTIISFHRLIKQEVMVQNALNNATEEISQFLYVVDALRGDEELEEIGIFEDESDENLYLLEVIKDAAIDEASSKIFSIVAEKYFLKYADMEKLDKLGVLLDSSMDFDNSKLFDGNVKLSIEYEVRPLINITNRNIKVRKNAISKIWSQYLSSNMSNSNSEDFVNENSQSKSIWRNPPMVRGRIFIERMRSEIPDEVVKKGNYVDFYNAFKNEATQVNSINIFSKSYSILEGENYKLRDDNLIKTLSKYATTLIESANTSSLEMQDGRLLRINNPTKVLKIIVPEEAIEFEKQLELLNSEVEGVKIEFVFLEKAL